MSTGPAAAGSSIVDVYRPILTFRLAVAARLLIGVLAFAVTAATVGHLAGLPEVGLLDDKLIYFARHGDDFDLLFFGSSRIYRGIDPRVFDRTLAARGQQVRSFNFGIAGMGTHETNALVRRVLRQQPARLRWVVVEAGEWDPVIHPRNRLKRRGIFWHDAPETLSALRSTLLLEAPLSRRADLVQTHLTHFAARGAAAGRGLQLLSDNRPGTAPTFEQRGFRTFSQRSYDSHPMRRVFLRSLDHYRQAVASAPEANEAEVSVHRYNKSALAAQVEMIRHAGVVPIHLVPPTPRGTPALYQLERAGAIPWLMAFNDPEAHPELFAIGRRFDREHLTAEGAELFTRQLAERFAGQVAAHRLPRL